MLEEKRNDKRPSENEKRRFKQMHKDAPLIECKCGCGKKTKSIDNWGRQKEYINGHSSRKYPVGYNRSKAWYEKNQERVKKESKEKYAEKRKLNRQFKIELIKLKGSKCIECSLEYNGKNAAGFDFHHRDPKEKKFDITAGMMNNTRVEVLEEVEKCNLMCGICHNMLHFGEY